jgi:hypothetical protein
MADIKNIVPGAILYYKNYNDDIHSILIIQKAPVDIPATYDTSGKIITQGLEWNHWGNMTSRYFKIWFENTNKYETNPMVKFVDNYKEMNSIYNSYFVDKDSEFFHDFREKCIKQIFSYTLVPPDYKF